MVKLDGSLKKFLKNKIIKYNNKRSIVDPQTLWFKRFKRFCL